MAEPFGDFAVMVEGRVSAHINTLSPNVRGESNLLNTSAQKRKARPHPNSVSSAEMKQADARLAEMGYGKGRTALIAYQKYEGRDVTGRLSREDFDAIMSASAPQAKTQVTDTLRSISIDKYCC